MKPLEVNIGDIKNNCTVIGIDTSGKDARVKARCNICGREISVYRYKFAAGKFRCNHGRRITNPEDYVGEVFGNIKLIEYLGKSEVLEGESFVSRPIFNVQCTQCGTIYNNVELHKVQSYRFTCSCEKKDYQKLFYDKYKCLIGRVIGTDKVIGLEYRPNEDHNNRALVRLKCNECGNERFVGVDAFLNSKNYKKCNCKPKTREVKDPIKRYNQLYLHKRFGKIVVENIIAGNTLQNTLAICKCDCGNTFKTILSNIVSGDTHSCGCIKSFGESVVMKELRERNIRFTYQQQMTDLFSDSGKRLTFDFMIFDDRNKGIAVIEVDGIQHRKPTCFGSQINHDEEEILNRYKRTVRNDRIKDEYVKRHGASMYRINTDKNTSELEIVAKVDKVIASIVKSGYNIFK